MQRDVTAVNMFFLHFFLLLSTFFLHISDTVCSSRPITECIGFIFYTHFW